jgi:hypothetical protein
MGSNRNVRRRRLKQFSCCYIPRLLGAPQQDWVQDLVLEHQKRLAAFPDVARAVIVCVWECVLCVFACEATKQLNSVCALKS